MIFTLFLVAWKRRGLQTASWKFWWRGRYFPGDLRPTRFDKYFRISHLLWKRCKTSDPSDTYYVAQNAQYVHLQQSWNYKSPGLVRKYFQNFRHLQQRYPSSGGVCKWPYPCGESIFQNIVFTFLKADSDSSWKSVYTNYFYFSKILMGTWSRLGKPFKPDLFELTQIFQFYQYLTIFPLELWKSKSSLYTHFFKRNLNLHSKKYKNYFEKIDSPQEYSHMETHPNEG